MWGGRQHLMHMYIARVNHYYGTVYFFYLSLDLAHFQFGPQHRTNSREQKTLGLMLPWTMARAINLPMVLNTLSSRAFVLCLRIRMCTGPLRILSCLFKVSIRSMKNSRRGPPPSTAGSPKNATRRCFLTSNGRLKALRASCQMCVCVRRTVMRWVFCVSLWRFSARCRCSNSFMPKSHASLEALYSSVAS